MQQYVMSLTEYLVISNLFTQIVLNLILMCQAYVMSHWVMANHWNLLQVLVGSCCGCMWWHCLVGTHGFFVYVYILSQWYHKQHMSTNNQLFRGPVGSSTVHGPVLMIAIPGFLCSCTTTNSRHDAPHQKLITATLLHRSRERWGLSPRGMDGLQPHLAPETTSKPMFM